MPMMTMTREQKQHHPDVVVTFDVNIIRITFNGDASIIVRTVAHAFRTLEDTSSHELFPVRVRGAGNTSS